MKKCKSVKLNLFNPIKSVYGTVDSKNLKSIYINIQSWVTPKNDDHNWNRVVSSLGREIKNSVTESLDQKIFLDKNIVDLDLRTSGISKGKKSFFPVIKKHCSFIPIKQSNSIYLSKKILNEKFKNFRS